MGKNSKYNYRLVIKDQKGETVLGLDRKPKNLDFYIHSYIDSFKIGGANEHISLDIGFIPVPDSAKLIDQRINQVVDEWFAPMFMVI